MRIPYGQSNFAALRHDRAFYADKTPFLPELESLESGYRYLIFLRPRRFGKSLLVTMLESYYDASRAGQFDDLFGGLWIHRHPTAERGQYLALTLDFSSVTVSGDPESMRRSFATTVKGDVRLFLMRYRDRFPDLAHLHATLDSYDDAAGLMTTLLSVVAGLGQKLYLFIDEYDHFANRMLAGGQEGLYETIVRETGFVRSFYAALKAGTRSGGLGRMFITGVSPILLDDLSSGFNIIRHVSMLDRFNAMAGFTRAEVEQATDQLLADTPSLLADPQIGDRAALLTTLERHYNGYSFSRRAAERVFNSDLVLYFLSTLVSTGRYPEQMLDINVRTDYGRLQRIASLSGKTGAATRELLETILTEQTIRSELVEQFGMRAMYGRAQLVSLFYYMGMLTFSPGAADTARPELSIPNRVIRALLRGRESSPVHPWPAPSAKARAKPAKRSRKRAS
ncbi:MAG: AAA family ATPase [Polyangiaceae bacterium]